MSCHAWKNEWVSLLMHINEWIKMLLFKHFPWYDVFIPYALRFFYWLTHFKDWKPFVALHYEVNYCSYLLLDTRCIFTVICSVYSYVIKLYLQHICRLSASLLFISLLFTSKTAVWDHWCNFTFKLGTWVSSQGETGTQLFSNHL